MLAVGEGEMEEEVLDGVRGWCWGEWCMERGRGRSFWLPFLRGSPH